MRSRSYLAGVFFLSAAYLVACSQDGGGGTTSTGGSGSGGTSAKGGSGGSGTGGTTATGGAASGGTTATGGSGTGGTTATGGSGTGGTTARGGSGGTTSAGGSGSGGTTSSGGSGGSGGTSTTSATGGTAGRGGSGGSGSGGSGGSGGSTGGSGGGAGTGGSSTGGSGTGGSGTGGNGTGGSGTGGNTGGLPPLKVNGTKLQDPNGKTIVLRGSSLIDIGALYTYGGNSAKGITDRMDKLAAAGVQGHVVRLPAYPKIDYNAGSSYCSPLPYPVGGTRSGSCAATSPMNAADYVSKVLKPAIDYATSKNLYVIIDHHQIDDATKNTSATEANTFWADIAPKFMGYSNVIFEPFNEPIDGSATWAQLKPVVQGWIDTIRNAGASNLIIVPSNSYCQRPGDAASDPPSDPKSNLMYTAHIYPGNWNSNFKTQVSTAAGKAPVFITEWGYILNSGDGVVGTNSATWGPDLRTLVDGNGASWTAWVTDNGWTPNMFSDTAITQLTDFGNLVKTWLAAKASSDWVM
jgi:hypothetical protein